MQKNLTQYVDVFYGNGAIDLPRPEGVAATWFFIKAQCGNTHPHAALPFGGMSCGLYTGGYPTGYGSHKPNSCGKVRTFEAGARGFSHLHQTGTGAIGTYYNYAVTTPLYGEIRQINEKYQDETGVPGYYAVTFGESGIRAEITVSEEAAYHRYHFEKEGKIMIDFSNDGLNRDFGPCYYGLAEKAEIRIEDENAVSAKVVLHETPLYFYAVCPGNCKKTSLWANDAETEEKVSHRNKTEERFGAVFTVEGVTEIRVSVSTKSIEDARKMASRDEGFDVVRQKAAEKWETYLSKIEIEGDERTKALFYSNLYHSLLKPARMDGAFTDFATLWDMYKTQLPLVFTLFKEEGCGIADTLRRAGETFGEVPNALMLCREYSRFEKQAKMLATHIMADAYYRGSTDGESVLKVAKGEAGGDLDARFVEMCKDERFPHVLDVSEGLHAAECIARETGETEKAEFFAKYAHRWRDAFEEDGLLKEGICYYEGDKWNYSFRLLSQMKKRIEIAGKDAFIKNADSFFGFGKEPVKQCEEPDDAKRIRDMQLHRFDGINNEHDMEAPYAYLFAGRHDRTCTVVRAIMQYMFTEGRGGLPGNNDTGALSSWFVWNALGLFPVSGQDKMLIGSPVIKSAKIQLASGKTLEVCVQGEGIFVEKAVWNGRKLQDMQFSVREMMQGGTIEIFLRA